MIVLHHYPNNRHLRSLESGEQVVARYSTFNNMPLIKRNMKQVLTCFYDLYYVDWNRLLKDKPVL